MEEPGEKNPRRENSKGKKRLGGTMSLNGKKTSVCQLYLKKKDKRASVVSAQSDKAGNWGRWRVDRGKEFGFY